MSLYAQTTAFHRFGDNIIASRLIADATGMGSDAVPNLLIDDTPSLPFVIGAISGPGDFASMAIACWCKWTRKLTTSECAYLKAGGVWPFSGMPSLLTGCVANFPFDDPANPYDSTGINATLSIAGVPTRVSFPYGSGYATKFVGTTTPHQYFYDNAPGVNLRYKQETHTVCVWVNMDSVDPSKIQVISSQLVTHVGSAMNLAIYSSRFWCDFDGGGSKDLSTGCIVADTQVTSPATGNWYFLRAEMDLDSIDPAIGNSVSFGVNEGSRGSISPRIQPVPAACKIGNGSKFQVNSGFTWVPPVSGWDTQAYPSVGNCFASVAASSKVNMGNAAKFKYCWLILPDPSGATQHIAGQIGTSGLTSDWGLMAGSAFGSGNIAFVFGKEQVSVTAPMPDTTNPHCVGFGFDPVANEISIRVDNGTVYTSAGPATPQTVSTPLTYGSNINNAQSRDVVLNAFGHGTGLLNDYWSEIWNGGAGYNYHVPGAFNPAWAGRNNRVIHNGNYL